MSLQQSLFSKSQEMPKITTMTKNLQWGLYPGHMTANCKNILGPKLEQLEQQNKVLLDYNPKYQVNIKFILI